MKTDLPEFQKRLDRREFIRKASAGTLIMAIGGSWFKLADEFLNQKAFAEVRADGRKRLPPGQRIVEYLTYMGGQAGDPRPDKFNLEVHGEVERPFTLNYNELLEMPRVEQKADVHCVTGWSLLDGIWSGVQVSQLADRAGLKKTANFVIFESHHGYTANISLKEALKPNVLVSYSLNGKPFRNQHGAPVRSLVPDLYFWKSAKWLKGIRFSKRDAPGFWETRGYHNIGDPWKEQRYG